MPTTTPTRPSTTETGTDTAPAVARTATEDKLWAALRARPDGATCAELATTAGIGRSTAAKILARWADDGSAARASAASTGGSGRAAERWTIPDVDPASPDDAPDPAASEAVAVDGIAVADGATSQVVTDAANGDTDGGLEPAVPTPEDLELVDTGVAPEQPTDQAGRDPAPEGETPTTGESAPQPRRLPAGGLRGMVEDYLRERPGDAFGPSQIGRALVRSSGAVANALEELVESGCAVVVQDKPRRYSLAPSEAVASGEVPGETP